MMTVKTRLISELYELCRIVTEDASVVDIGKQMNVTMEAYDNYVVERATPEAQAKAKTDLLKLIK
ncbi:TPA: hypothetical protein H2W70_004106 [Salmonella enterica]|nr:hypothetical protein [Salmonella enterica]HAK8195210.1 hypothetical protein [Salmonella enterica]HAK8434558.1 hypothetical protein [Salmonella enterica]HAK8462306.1 hypothetical protein [Salmonella enterica]